MVSSPTYWEMSNLCQLSARAINERLSSDAIEQLYGDIYVPYVENVCDIFAELDEKDGPTAVRAFVESFPELTIEIPPEKRDATLNEIHKDLSWPGCMISEGNDRAFAVAGKVPFDFKRNNRLLRFFVSRRLPVFAGIKHVVRASDFQQ